MGKDANGRYFTPHEIREFATYELDHRRANAELMEGYYHLKVKKELLEGKIGFFEEKIDFLGKRKEVGKDEQRKEFFGEENVNAGEERNQVHSLTGKNIQENQRGKITSSCNGDEKENEVKTIGSFWFSQQENRAIAETKSKIAAKAAATTTASAGSTTASVSSPTKAAVSSIPYFNLFGTIGRKDNSADTDTDTITNVSSMCTDYEKSVATVSTDQSSSIDQNGKRSGGIDRDDPGNSKSAPIPRVVLVSKTAFCVAVEHGNLTLMEILLRRGVRGRKFWKGFFWKG